MPNYNHYTPQSDGSYRRSTVAESSRRPTQKPPYPVQQPQKPPQEPPKAAPCDPPEPPCPPPPTEPPCHPQEQGILTFLRGLLPRQIDAADLLVISLLLLMNREEGDSGMSPLLTIALYFLL